MTFRKSEEERAALERAKATLDQLGFSLDDVSTNPLAQLSVMGAGHTLSFLSGANLEATLARSSAPLPPPPTPPTSPAPPPEPLA